MPELNRFLTIGLLLASTALMGQTPSFAAPNQPAQQPAAQVTDAATPETATLQSPDAATLLDQQAQIQSTGDLSLDAAPADPAANAAPQLQNAAQQAVTPNPAPSPVLAAPAQPQVQTPDASNLPTLSAVLEQAGIDGDDSANTQPETPLQAPPLPGLDLPLNENLPEAQTEQEKQMELRQQAFGAASQGLMPMKTEEIRKLLEMYDETQQAVQTPIYPNPKPESTFQTISLDPGEAPVEIRTAVGHVTTLSMVDASGQPWPIQDISWAGNFEVLQPESGSNMLRITPMADFAFGNVSMRMVGLNPPVILTLRTERKSVQLRADIQIPEIGPKGIAPPIQRQITTTAGDLKLSTILEGVPPSSANKLKIDGIDGRTTAYELNGVTYVRTPYTLLSPAWDSSVRSADGTNVYAMKFTPVLLLSDKGKMLRAQLTKAGLSDE